MLYLTHASYHLISTLNVDYKLFELIALHMESILAYIMYLDKRGLNLKSALVLHLINPFNTIYNATSSNAQEVLVSLEVDKTFNNMDGNCLVPLFIAWGSPHALYIQKKYLRFCHLTS